MKNKFTELRNILHSTYEAAEALVIEGDYSKFIEPEPNNWCSELARTKHAFRGAALTLIAYKIASPEQDIRSHKKELFEGFSARSYDTKVTVPFLIEKSLPYSSETHWLTQTLSFSPELKPGVILKTQPKKAGPLLLKVIGAAQEGNSKQLREMLITIFIELINIRNQDKVILTKPKNLSIDSVKNILRLHFEYGYKNNAPRLPQLAIYAIYKAILDKMTRFANQKIEPLQRMKSADKKSGSVGDIVLVNQANKPVEAVEIKFGKPITYANVLEAIEKVRGAAVSRYYMLSTNGISEEDTELIKKKQLEFLKQNGCEIIVNGVIETIGYYLRLLPNTTEFISHYAGLVEIDEDTGYEQRIAWNNLCQDL